MMRRLFPERNRMFKFAAFLVVTFVTFALTSVSIAQTLPLVSDGKPTVSIVVDQAVLDLDLKKRNPDPDLKFLRWAADDLVEYLGKLTGAKFTIAAKPVEGLVPIYVGNAPDAAELGIASKFGDAYLIDVSAKRVVLAGESSRAVSYAASQLLHGLGVRWYAPGEIGEYVPPRADYTLSIGAQRSKPSFHTRNFWADHHWAARNRMNGPAMAQGHAFYHLMDGRKPFDEHPEYFPMYNGKPIKTQANLSHPAVVEMFTKNLRAQLEKGTNWAGNGAGIGPDDGALLDERPESRAMDSGRMDPLLKLPSATDKFIKFCNQISENLEADFPDSYFGFYVYSNHKMPPKDVKPHRMLFPIIAPITFNRYTSIGKDGAPTMKMLESWIKQWAEVSPRLGTYLYNFNLADVAMPFTRTLYWQKTLPRINEWGIEYATVESMDDNWHGMVPGNYVASQLLWNVDQDMTSEIEAFYRNYYGPAGPAMKQYNLILEQAYENTDAYAGSIWSMHLILTPQVRKQLHAALAQAEKAATAAPFSERVNIARYQLNFSDIYFTSRDALNQGRLADAATEVVKHKQNWEEAAAKYPKFFGKYAWRYFSVYHAKPFEDAGRVAKEGRVIAQLPDELPGVFDPDRLGIEDQWYHTGPVASTWRTLKTGSATISEQGNPFFRGYIWYRHDFKLPAADRAAESIKLWMSSIDDTAHVFLNGEKLGVVAPGRLGPGEIDLAPKLNREGNNVLVIAVDNGGITELGTGGLMRPAFLYVPNKTSETKPGETGDGKSTPKGPLFTTE